VGDFRRRDRAEVEPLAAGLDRREDLVGLGGGEDELDMIRRLFEDLEQGVEGAGAEHVDFVDDVNLEAGAGRAIEGVLAEVADVVHAVVGGPVDLDDIDVVAVVDGQATVALAAGGYGGAVGLKAVEGLGQQAGHRGLADTAGPGKEVRMGNAAGGDGVAKGLRDGLLAHDIVEGLRTITPCENRIGHKN
jgi:hypothetical protein